MSESKPADKNIEKEKAKKPNRAGIILFAALLVVAGLCIGAYFFIENTRYFVTDNAKVAAKLYSIYPLSSGKLVNLRLREGSRVEKDQVLAVVEEGPYVCSPINGMIVRSDVVLGENVTPATVLGVVADLSDICIEANIEETEIAKIREHQTVSVKLDAYPGKKFTGYVKHIDHVTQSMLKGGVQSMTTSGTYAKVKQLFTVKIYLSGQVRLDKIIGTNATVKIDIS